MLSSTRHSLLRGSAVRANAIRNFHPSPRTAVKIGDLVPNVELQENSPGNKVNLSKELTGKGVIIGVPAAYCTEFLPPLVFVAENFPCRLASTASAKFAAPVRVFEQ
jgi:hypothetical protein